MKKNFCFIVILAILLVIPFKPTAVSDGGLNVEKRYAAVLIESETGEILHEENPDVTYPIGGQVKLMSALLFAEEIESGRLALNDIVTASSNVYGMKGASVWLMPGEQMSVEDMLKAVLIGNANDAAAALAERVAGTQEKFVVKMNTRAFDLGLRSTFFRDCTGLDDTQVSTARELAVLAREVVKHPVLIPFMTTWRDFVRGEKTELVNENELVKGYNGVTGLKAAHSPNSGHTLALSCERGGKAYIAVVLGCAGENGAKQRFSVAKSLIEKGFSEFTVTNPYFSSEFMKPLPVKGGVDAAVETVPLETTSLIVATGKADEIVSVVFLPNYIEAPVRKGQRIGAVAFYLGDTRLYQTPLIAKKDVAEFTLAKAFLRLIEEAVSK